MSKDEHAAYWQCRICGTKSPENTKLCRHCSAELALFGDIVMPEEPTTPPPPPPPSPPSPPRRKWWLIGLVAVLVIVLLGALALPWLGDSGDDTQLSEPDIPTTEHVVELTLLVKHRDITLSEIGQTYTFEMIGSLKNDQVTWSSMDESIAGIDENGTVTCTGWGVTKIIVCYDSGEESRVITCTVRCLPK